MQAAVLPGRASLSMQRVHQLEIDKTVRQNGPTVS
jgi:hypothetical protein